MALRRGKKVCTPQRFHEEPKIHNRENEGILG